MLKITIPSTEQWDEEREMFISTKSTELCLEHSLVSVSKWESKWHKPFIGNESITHEQLVDYVRCMTLTQNVNPEVYYAISEAQLFEINEYIKDPHTATWFAEDYSKKKTNREVITAEIIYYWMIGLQIPFECQKWHLNKLLTLIRVCNEKNQPDNKMSQSEIMRRNREINEARRRAMNSRG